MPDLVAPKQLYRDQPANFRIRLAPCDPEGTYEFQFAPVKSAMEDVGFAQRKITRFLVQGNMDADLEVRFKRLGTRVLQYRFRDVDDHAEEEQPDAGGAAGGTSAEASTLAPGRPATRTSSKTQSASAARAARTKTDDDDTGVAGRSATITVSRPRCRPGWTAPFALAVTPPPSSPDEELWFFIRSVTERMRFAEFHEFVQPRMIGCPRRSTGPTPVPTSSCSACRSGSSSSPRTRSGPSPTRFDPSFGEISLTTARAGVRRSYVSDEDLDLAQPFLGFDGVLTAPFRPAPATTTTTPTAALQVEATATGTTTGAGSRRGGRAAPGTITATSGHASSRCPTCRSWNCCGPTGWTSAVWRRR